MTDFVIDGQVRGRFLQPYIIAEIGVNHEGSLESAKSMIDEVADAGGHAAKFQTYKAELLAAKESPAYWDLDQEPTTSQRELFKKYDSFGPDEYSELAAHCNTRGIDFLSTPFDLDAVDMLDPHMKLFKIASADILNVPLLRSVASKGKPVVVSTGASTLPEIQFALDTLYEAGAKSVCLLHCVLNYPTAEEDAQILNIEGLSRAFPELAIGYSDHVVPDNANSALQLAIMLGAVVLEKHYTYDKTLAGNDHYHAMDKGGLAAFVDSVEVYHRLAGSRERRVGRETAAREHARRSIVAATNIRKGEQFTEQNLITKRPGSGISSIHWDEILGAIAATSIDRDELINWQQVTAGVE